MKATHKLFFLITLCCLLMPSHIWGAKKVKQVESGMTKVTLHGYVGKRIDQCIEKRVKNQNVDEIVAPFYQQNEKNGMWQTEFWGKWVQGAMGSFLYTGDSSLYQKIEGSVEKMLAAQLPDGYMGNYDKDHQLSGWDVWGRKYTLLGLIKWYRISGDKKALKAACRLADYTLGQIGPGKRHIYRAGFYRGMPPSSILEPIMFLYQETKEEKYLDFAKFIVSDWEKPEGPQLLTKADVPVAQRFVLKDGQNWWSWENGQKAYEMMSCYVGLLELMRTTGQKEYLDIAERVYQHILKEEINICGSGSSYECWYDGASKQTRPSTHSMETCVTFTWMQFNERLWEFHKNPLYIDEIEKTMYNALMASMKADGSDIAKYIPLEGYRQEGGNQCGLNIHCCNANGPRAFAMIPRLAYNVEDNKLLVNLFIPSEVEAKIEKQNVQLTQETNYPKDGVIEITVNPEKEAQFSILLRIPAWSQQTQVEVNGEKVNGVTSKNYLSLERTWEKGDKISLHLDMRTRLTELNHCQALLRGPIVLTRDTRFADGFVDECCIIPSNKDGFVDVRPCSAPEGIWLAFEAKLPFGTYGGDVKNEYRIIRFCDFASAGNTWDDTERYRVWLPKTLDAQKERTNP